MDSLRVDPTHLVVKIGYQGIRCYVTATDPTLRSEEKSNETPLGASSKYQAYGPIAQLGERLTCNQEDWVRIPSCPRRILYFDVIKSTGGNSSSREK